MVTKRKFVTVYGGDSFTITTDEQKHAVPYRNNQFHTFNAVNGRGHRVVDILLVNGSAANTLSLLEVAGGNVLNSRGFVWDGDTMYLIKEGYDMNLSELRIYLEGSFGAGVVPPLTRHNKLLRLSTIAENALSSQRVTTFITNRGDFSSLGRKVVTNVTAGLTTYTEEGFRVADLSECNIAVKLMRDCSIRFKLIAPLAAVTGRNAFRQAYVDFLRVLRGVNQADTPVLADLFQMLTPPEDHLDSILWRQAEDFVTAPRSVLFHPFQWKFLRRLQIHIGVSSTLCFRAC
ncbi:uncharacterized protein LOC113319488 [Papaver somniferum]|uniref:uncharacterized protein LOC113319488 n=1 Tax=Papaver somniferum TaxID=3469 RepID=UPI000E7024FD|nr:uncharacterized protein LOC113319488 [Papaver somniferum]